MKLVMSITPEVSLPCPWCSSLFSSRKFFLAHVKKCYEREQAGDTEKKIKFYFCKPKY